VGLRKIELDELKRRETRKKGAKLAIDEIEDMIKSIKTLHKQLEKLEKKYEQDMSSNPEVSKRVMAIREELGLPETLGIFKKRERPSLTDKLTGGGYYEDLALRILELGRSQIEKTGGLLSTAEVIVQLNKKYEGLVVSISDILKALKILKKHDLVFSRKIPSGVEIIEFVQQELSEDHEKVLELATQNGGEIGLEEILTETKWNLERTENTLQFLEEKNITERHKTLDGIKYIFYGL